MRGRSRKCGWRTNISKRRNPYDENGNPSVEGLGENSFVGTKGQAMTQLRNLVYFNTPENTPEENAVRLPDYQAENSGKTISPIGYYEAGMKGPWKETVGAGIMPTPNADVMRFYE